MIRCHDVSQSAAQPPLNVGENGAISGSCQWSMVPVVTGHETEKRAV
jgi:hypothetical protein